MFVKWREEDARQPQRHRWYAYLAKSQRVEGKLRQKVLYLASIPARCAAAPDDPEWRMFWYKAHCALLLAEVGLGCL